MSNVLPYKNVLWMNLRASGGGDDDVDNETGGGTGGSSGGSGGEGGKCG